MSVWSMTAFIRVVLFVVVLPVFIEGHVITINILSSEIIYR